MDERLTVATLDSPSCPVGERIGSIIGSGNSSGLDILSISTNSLTDGLGLLESGDADILALPGGLVHGNMMEILQSGCNVVGARTPVRPYPVLVSDNKIQYQPKSAILLCDNKLNRRQVRRSRGGLRVLDPDAFASILGIEAGPSDPLMKAKWMEDLRRAGEIDGFVIPRGGLRGCKSGKSEALPTSRRDERGRSSLSPACILGSNRITCQKSISEKYLQGDF